MTHLHARYATAGVLVMWQEGGESFIGRSRGGTVTASALDVDGAAMVPVGAAENDAGVLAFLERDSATASREIVIAQACPSR